MMILTITYTTNYFNVRTDFLMVKNLQSMHESVYTKNIIKLKYIQRYTFYRGKNYEHHG